MKYMMFMKSAILACFFSASASAEPLLIEKSGTGASEFEAMKVAYSKIFHDAVKVVSKTDRESQLSASLTREIEEDLLKFTHAYTPDAVHRCERDGSTTSCHVWAPVQMDEVEAWVREQLQISGKDGGRLADIDYALIVESEDAVSQDFAAWLHSKLEQDLSYDIYFTKNAIRQSSLENSCEDYRERISEVESKGAGFSRSLKSLKKGLAACDKIATKDVIIVLRKFSLIQGEYNGGNSSLEGRGKVSIQFFDMVKKRPLAGPKPLSFVKYGMGSSETMALEDLKNNAYEDGANYVSQQFNDIVLSNLSHIAKDKSGNLNQYTLTISGLNQDLKVDRRKRKFVINWLRDEMGLDVKADIGRMSDAGERLYQVKSGQPVQWEPVIDELYDALDDEGHDARIDIDTNYNVFVAFNVIQENSSNDIDVFVDKKKLSRFLSKRVKITSAEVVLRRRDQKSGVAMSIHEANVEITNSYKKDLALAAYPKWYDAEGVEQLAPYDDTKFILVEAKATKPYVFRAPNRFAERLELFVDCENKDCK